MVSRFKVFGPWGLEVRVWGFGLGVTSLRVGTVRTIVKLSPPGKGRLDRYFFAGHLQSFLLHKFPSLVGEF